MGLPSQRRNFAGLPWLYIVMILIGLGSFLASVMTLQLRYLSRRGPVTRRQLRALDDDLRYFAWLTVILALLSAGLEYFLLRRGHPPRGASYL